MARLASFSSFSGTGVVRMASMSARRSVKAASVTSVRTLVLADHWPRCASALKPLPTP
jgi:hypothetical protein